MMSYDSTTTADAGDLLAMLGGQSCFFHVHLPLQGNTSISLLAFISSLYGQAENIYLGDSCLHGCVILN